MDIEILQLLDQLHKDPDYRKFEEDIINDKFNEIKRDIINKFNNHLVTREIEGGIYAENISKTLNNITNLYSFIGFEAGTDPISPIRNLLEKSKFRIRRLRKGSISNVIFDIPTAIDIFNETPMPWAEGRSWAKGIEQGISGLGWYLKKVKNSRSGLGIQSQDKIRDYVKFRNTTYISSLINEFNSELEKLNKLIV